MAFKNFMSGQPRDNFLPAGFSSSEVKPEKSDAKAKQAAWAEFTKQFPNADKTKFAVQTYIDAKNNITAEVFFIACVAGGIRERASVRRSRHIPSRASPAREFTSSEAASEFPACHISYGFCLPPTFITFDNPII